MKKLILILLMSVFLVNLVAGADIAYVLNNPNNPDDNLMDLRGNMNANGNN